MSTAQTLSRKGALSYFVFEQVANGSWQLGTLALAPDPGTACEYYLGDLRSKPRHSDSGSSSRDVRILGVSTDPLGCLFGHFIPASSSDRFIFFYRGW
jgi:hypothetical protein